MDVATRGKESPLLLTRIDVCVELAPRLKAFQQSSKTYFIHSPKGVLNKRVPLTIATHQMPRFFRAFDLVVIDETDSFIGIMSY